MLCASYGNAETSMYKTTLHSMAEFGGLHCSEIPPDALDMLRAHCLKTPPFCVASANNLFTPQVLQLLQQAHLDVASLHIAKLSDGFALLTPQNKLVCVIKDTRLCEPQIPEGYTPVMRGTSVRVTQRNGDNHKSIFCSIVQDPSKPPIRPMMMVHHNGLTEPHEVSMFSPVDAVISHLSSQVPMVNEPRTLFASPSLGTVTGRQLSGTDADFMKKVLLEGISQARSMGSAADIYDRPIKISDTVGKLFNMRPSEDGHEVCVARLNDGIALYRKRKDKLRSLVGVAYSNDFDSPQPDPVQRSQLNVLKVTYKDSDQSSPRIFVRCPGDQIDPPVSEYGTPSIDINDATVAKVRQIIEHAFRTQICADKGCECFPAECKAEAKLHLMKTGNRLYDPQSVASRLVLGMPDSGFEGSFGNLSITHQSFSGRRGGG